MITILLVEDHQILREGVAALLNQQPDLRVVGAAKSSREAVELARSEQPDVAIVDLRLGDEDGIPLLRKLRYQRDDMRTMVLSMYDDEATVQRAMRAGADAYVLKGGGVAALREAIAAVTQGDTWLDPKLPSAPRAGSSGQPSRPGGLTQRELDIVVLVTAGHTSGAIGQQLGLATKTVQNHRARILDKLGVPNTARLVRWAVENGVSKD